MKYPVRLSIKKLLLPSFLTLSVEAKYSMPANLSADARVLIC